MTNTFTDPRDGQIYRTVRVNGQLWLAQNLNYDVGEGCWFYDNDPVNGEKYGRLYTWDAAMKACPEGWRLATDKEWRALAMAHGGLYDGDDQLGVPKQAYSALIGGGGSGFDALPGGWRYIRGDFLDLGDEGYYWSATEDEDDPAWSWSYKLGRRYGHINKALYRFLYKRDFGFSVRCVQDAGCEPPTYWIGRVSTQVVQNHQAWAIWVEGGFKTRSQAEKKAAELQDQDLHEPAGHVYLVFEE